MAEFRLERAPDWPADMRLAADAYERDVMLVSAARNETELTAALDRLAASKAWFGRCTLALDKLRRPAMYREGGNG